MKVEKNPKKKKKTKQNKRAKQYQNFPSFPSQNSQILREEIKTIIPITLSFVCWLELGNH